jgi:hypothetical protein
MGAGMSAVRRGELLALYRVRGGVGRLGVRGEWVAAVVHHNGMKAAISERNRLGWWWGVMRSRCSGRYGSGRETAAAVVQTGRKMTGRGPHVTEGGEGKAGWAGRRLLGWLASGPERRRGDVGRG